MRDREGAEDLMNTSHDYAIFFLFLMVMCLATLVAHFTGPWFAALIIVVAVLNWVGYTWFSTRERPIARDKDA